MNLPWGRLRKIESGTEAPPERRRCMRHRVHAPAFASFDGVTGGMVLDLSEQGMSMQTAAPQKVTRPINLHLNLPDPITNLETTGYIAWADAFGRAGVRFSELPEEPRRRLHQWLATNAGAPSRTAPKLAVAEQVEKPAQPLNFHEPLAISLEPEPASTQRAPESTTVQYEFASLGPDLDAALRLIVKKLRSLTRAAGAAIALVQNGKMVCRARTGLMAPPLGSPIDADSGFTGECLRSGKALRCDNSETDGRVEAETCRRLGLRSILAAPIQYERDIVGVIEVFSGVAFAFDEGDVAVLQRLAQTVLLAMSQAESLNLC
ncbi:MAG TPA: GAF domain-containing protein [Terriglobales bacterium]|nr:GAF domain-containing protein [Terriglobales bacterium]